MNLILDFGNTKIKAAVFEQDKLVEKNILDYLDWKKEIQKILQNYLYIKNLVVSSVSKVEKNDFDFINQSKTSLFFIDKTIKFPFNNLYSTPHTLGIDRLILVTGASIQFPYKNKLIIDAGTCITYDFLDNQNNYFGGAISPGLNMRYQALNNYTAKLPLLNLEMPESIIGNSTNQSIHSGVVNGVLFEIDGVINSYSEKYENFIIILTGGDTEFLSKRLKNTIFANSNFLLESLNQSFQFNKYV